MSNFTTPDEALLSTLEPGDGPLVIGIGGTTRPTSSTTRALATSLEAAAACGARTLLIAGDELDLPMFDPTVAERHPRARALIECIRRADGLIIGSPGYHGGISGRVKNALDYIEDLRDGEEPYLSGRAVGLLVCADGWQAAVTTLTALRSVIHALRGWPTPLGVAINARAPEPTVDGGIGAQTRQQLEAMGRQVVEFTGGQVRSAV